MKTILPVPPLLPIQIEAFWSRVDRRDSCWNWTGVVTEDGYGRFTVQRRPLVAHRISYTLSVAPIPEGLVVDHLCRNRKCVNPEHLEPVTSRINTIRGDRAATKYRSGAICPAGHELTPDNVAKVHGRPRGCKACNRARLAKFRSARRH